jgi:anti-anti-sigma factor
MVAAAAGTVSGRRLRHGGAEVPSHGFRVRRLRLFAQPQPGTTLNPDEFSFRCDVVPESDAVRVRPIGSLDIATVPVLDQQLQELRKAGWRQLIVDLGGLSFMDSTGLHLALKWDAEARQDGFEIAFIPGQPAVQRVFEITGTNERMPFMLSRARPRPAGSD